MRMRYNSATPGNDPECDAYNLLAATLNKDRSKAATVVHSCATVDVLGVILVMLAAVLKGAGEVEANALADIGQKRAERLPAARELIPA